MSPEVIGLRNFVYYNLIEEAIGIVKRETLDAIVAISGDSAKGGSARACHYGGVWDFYARGAKISSAAPFFAVAAISA
jgi:alcohol dehydrogenase YqhD (iron-dependent ADH family)